jgi:ABC-2 type transport system permease protein
MWNSVLAELIVLRKRTAVWVLLGLWTLMAANFAYVFEYVTYLNGSSPFPDNLLPSQLVGNMLEGYPFFGGVIVLILGALTLGGEYGWGTWKTLYTQGPGRSQIFAAKLAALGIVLTAFVLVPFAVNALISYLIALRGGVSTAFPGIWLLARGIAAGWFLLAVWATFGAVLAVLSRGTALAIGIGILYGLVIEGLISAFVDRVDALRPIAEAFLRTNGYSLVNPLGIATDALRDRGPGSFSGPFVDPAQAFLILGLYIGCFALVSATLLHRRDVV